MIVRVPWRITPRHKGFFTHIINLLFFLGSHQPHTKGWQKRNIFSADALGFGFNGKKKRFLQIKKWLYSNCCHMYVSWQLADIGPFAYNLNLSMIKLNKIIFFGPHMIGF